VANSADFVAHVLELSKPQARISSRAMFGGHGIYADGVIVAIVVDDTLYLKCDDANRGEFEALGLEMEGGAPSHMATFGESDPGQNGPK